MRSMTPRSHVRRSVRRNGVMHGIMSFCIIEIGHPEIRVRQERPGSKANFQTCHFARSGQPCKSLRPQVDGAGQGEISSWECIPFASENYIFVLDLSMPPSLVEPLIMEDGSSI
jgi:hypothetical protein